MKTNDFGSTIKAAARVVSVLLSGAIAGLGQQQVNLTARPAGITLPDGSGVPMWGYSCGALAAGVASTATCSALHPAASGGVLGAIAVTNGGTGYTTAPTVTIAPPPAGTGNVTATATAVIGNGGQVIGISITNPGFGYTAAPAVTITGAGTNAAATALLAWSPVVITVPTGQTLQINLTNSLSFTPAGTATPNNVPTSLVIVGQLGGGLGGTPVTTASPSHAGAQAATTWPIANLPGLSGSPPPQQPRVQSFATEVAVGTTATALTWTAPRPGTYLLESGTHPSIQGTMGLYGMVVVTCAPGAPAATCTAPGTAYPAIGAAPAVIYNADVPLLFSEIDPVQNNAVFTAVNTAGFSETKVWSGQPGGCGNPSSGAGIYNTCYPPAVNYTPLYYLINGVAFNKTNASASLFPATPVTGVAGTVLLRLVNAGLRMHVPSIVGSLTGGSALTPAVPGLSLIAEDGNPLPGIPRIQSNVFMAAGKTYDLMVNVPAAGGTALPVYDRELSLSGNATERDAGMLAYISINGAGLPAAPAFAAAVANNDSYGSVLPCAAAPCTPLVVSDPAKGVIANDINVYGVKVATAPAKGTLTFNANGTFTYLPNAAWTSPDTFVYQANGSGPTATVTLSAATVESPSGITCTVPGPPTYTSALASSLSVKPPGVLSFCKDGLGYPLKVALSAGNAPVPTGLTTLSVDPNGGFNATAPTCTTATGCQYSFTFKAQNSQGVVSANTAIVTLLFPAASNLAVTVVDAQTKAALAGQDYRWIIEEDQTFYVNPNCTTNPLPASCPTVTTTTSGGVPASFGTNFHTSHMPFVAQGCTGPLSCESGQTIVTGAGTHVPTACNVGNGVCTTSASMKTPLLPSQVHLDPKKRYYISVLPGDAANPFSGVGTGHTMSGAPIPAPCAVTATTCTTPFAAVAVLVQATPLPPGKLSVMVFEDDFPLNGEQDSGGGVDILSPNEPGLGGFNIILWDDMGASGDVTGQMTYDMFNMPLSNSLAGQIDPVTGLDACPISKQATTNPVQAGITGMIVTCPKYEADGITLSPLAGQAVVANLMPGRFSVQAIPGADRIARGEEWLQTNTLDGQHPHDSFIRIGEPAYFQEFGPSGYHVSIGFANPKIINDRYPAVCAGQFGTVGACNNTVTGRVTGIRMSRTPDERLFTSGSRDTFYWTQCFVSLGDPDAEDFMITKCAADGTFRFSGVPGGQWRLTIFDQWNDQIVDGLSTAANVSGGQTLNMGDVGVQQWQSNVYTRTFIDDNRDGVSQSTEAGIPLLNTTVRYRDGSLANNLLTDFTGTANFNETFPLFSWYTVETDNTRYKTTGLHVVYDAGGPSDGGPIPNSTGTGTVACSPTSNPPCGTSTIGQFLANTYEKNPLPPQLSVPGAVYCATGADCTGYSIQNGRTPSNPGNHSTGRIDPPWVESEGWQGFSGQNNFIEFGKTPYAEATATTPAENGGIRGHVIYASTRPFDDPQMLVQTQWEPLVPHVTVNLYQEGFAADKVTPTLTLVDTTQTSSWDDWAQGFRSNGVPNMNCPGQSPSDLFFFTLQNQPEYLDWYNSLHGGPAPTPLPAHSQYKCYDGMHNWNQIQPAPYDGMYQFPSVIGMNPNTGLPSGQGSTNGTRGSLPGTNCTICIPNPDSADHFRFGTPMLPSGKYVVEVVVPPGFELVKEEDKNILIGDNFIAPVAQQFGGLSSIFIIPDQASVASAYNANNAQNPTQSLGASPNNQIVPGFVPEPVWPCVGAQRIVPDFISLFPQSKEVSPFAGATRNLCDRKEVTLADQMAATAKFYIYTSTHIAAKFTGAITDDFTSEFDPFAPTFGEKFSPPNMPVSIKDYTGNEISRVYSDQYGLFDGLTFSTWEVNPPNPTGYSPTMMVTCMNDAGPVLDTNPLSPTYNTLITDPLFNPQYSQFCYELPFMPGTTDYMDTPVVPTAAFSAGYNHPDCAYPDATPAVKEVDGDGVGPWVSAAGKTLTIYALGDVTTPGGTTNPGVSVVNYGYSGPSAHVAPFNQKTITRHYSFGGTKGTVKIGGVAVPLGDISWSDTIITVKVPSGVPNCAVQQQAQYAGAIAQCGELLITAANGRQSVDTVTVTIGGKPPTRLAAGQTIQSAIDAAAPGDLIIVPAGTYNEMVIMWKPVRLQGVGAASSIVNANAHPAGKMLDPWRRQVGCMFGLALNGAPYTAAGGTNPYDPTGTFTCPGSGWNNFSGGPNNPQIDRLPLEAVVGWTATLNGNLAELLQEPTLLGAYEGAGITVLGKGLDFHGQSPWSDAAEAGGFPTVTTLLQNTPGIPANNAHCTDNPNPYPSNFECNPSSIDALSVTDSSQGGGGIFVHGWAHNLQIANNRVYNNTGTLSGGISVGQGEFAPAYIQGSATNAAPGSCITSAVNGQQLPYCLDLNVNVHNNSLTENSSIGDELFSATLAGGGGVSFCTGSDYYLFNYNWVCGNMSSGEGGGFAHLGFIYNGDIEHNSILFNQSINPTIPTNGGGIMIQGTPDTDPTCGTQPDQDCPPGLSDGTGPGLVINANLIQGNASESGSGGGLRLQSVNGTEVSSLANPTTHVVNPGTCVDQAHCLWYLVNVTNNIIVDNVAGWDGAGVSLQDALVVNFVNNTIAHNDSTATSGVLNNTLNAPLASVAPPPGFLGSTPQVAGLVSVPNTALLTTTFTGLTINCPAGHNNCTEISNPILYDDILWQNRSFYVAVGTFSTGFQQNTVTLYNAFTTTPAASQTSTGACPAFPSGSYWDIGIRGDTSPTNHTLNFTLSPAYSVLTSTTGYSGLHNSASNPAVVAQYCNGSRVPPECNAAAGCFAGAVGWSVNPGISDAVVPNPIFSLTPTATVDEGNNWINLIWGPLSMINPNNNAVLGNYSLQPTSPAINYIPCSGSTTNGCSVAPGGSLPAITAPRTDFFGNPRPDTGGSIDIGAVELPGH